MQEYKERRNKMKKSIILLLSLLIGICILNKNVFAYTPQDIGYEDGFYYATEVHELTSEPVKFPVYCLNNELAWPNERAIHYDRFYEALDDETKKILRTLLYIGYPYNGESLYKIGDGGSIDKEFFDSILANVPAIVSEFDKDITKYPITSDNAYSEPVFSIVTNFMSNVFSESINGNPVAKAIESTAFYKAIMCVNYEEPWAAFEAWFASGTVVNEHTAYLQTQYAVWHLMNQRGFAYNSMEVLEADSLAEKLYNYAIENVNEYEYDLPEYIDTDVNQFVFNENLDGLYYSEPITISPVNGYLVPYELILPEGMSVLNGGNTVYASVPFTLVSDKDPKVSQIKIKALFDKPSDVYAYSPKDGQVNPTNQKEYQNMGGLYILERMIEKTLDYTTQYIPPFGDLTMSKKVINYPSWLDQSQKGNIEFTFDIEIIEGSIEDGTYGDLVFNNGKATVILKDGQSLKGKDLPSDTVYKIVERESLLYPSQSQTIKIEKTKNIDVLFENSLNEALPYGEMTIKKSVVNKDDVTQTSFEFVLEITDIKEEYRDYPILISGNENKWVYSNENGVIKEVIELKDEETVTILGLPKSSQYTLYEQFDSQNKAVYKVSVKENNRLIKENILQSEDHSIKNTVNENDKYDYIFENERVMADLTIKKIVKGGASSLDKQFMFTVTLDEKLNGVYGDMNFIDGVATVYLAHGQSASAISLPVNVKYTVSEDPEEYRVKVKSDKDADWKNQSSIEGILDEDSLIEFENSKEFVVPTGIDNDLKPYVVLLLIGLIVIPVKIRKRIKHAK